MMANTEQRKRFLGKTVLVTGGASGIGQSAVQRFSAEGASLIIVDKNKTGADEVAADLEKRGLAALAIEADVSKEEDCETMVSAALAHFGKLDVVFANAGVGGGGLVPEMDYAAWDAVIRVNLGGVFLTCKHTIPALISSGGGAIVNMSSSMAGWDTSQTGAAYMASKEGVSGLTKSLALQLGGYGIRVNAVCPGVIRTRLGFRPGMSEAEYEARYTQFAQRIPLRRVGQPQDVASPVAFLASDEARHITGAMLLIDGGQTLQSWSNAPEGEAYPRHPAN